MTTLQIEIAVARFFDTRVNLIVPNISWGLGLHECDLLIISKKGYAKEIEIKISKYDLIKDLEKEHKHESDKIKEFYFAIPENLEEHIGLIPQRAGIIIVKEANGNRWCKRIREPEKNTKALKITDKERFHVAELCMMRYWNLKEKIKELI